MMKRIRQFAHSGSMDPTPAPYEAAHRAIARTAAAEGIVLLKNDGLLPLNAAAPVALLGGGAGRTVKGGTGSGDVNQRDAVSIFKGLQNAGVTITSLDWLSDYDSRYAAARESWKREILGNAPADQADVNAIFENYARKTFRYPDGRSLSDADVTGAEAAVYVVARIAGEAADRKPEKGDYYLTDNELADLRYLNERGIPTALVLNAGGPVDLNDADGLEQVRAILYIAQPGQEGGNAVADILTGAANPSGKLTDTWAKNYSDYPFSDEYSFLDGHPEKSYYKEGIYVGYRYFDAFGVTPRYPFGFGLSYTGFKITYKNAAVENGSVNLTAAVENVGNVPGKEVVQLYASCPQTAKLPKEKQRLAGFVKTKLLAPGEMQEVQISVCSKMLASFSEQESCWLLEAGAYGLWLGSSSAELSLCAALTVAEDCVIERVQHICPLLEPLDELTPPEISAPDYSGVPAIPFVPVPVKLPSYAEDETDREAARLAEEIPMERLIPLLYGEIAMGQGALGAAAIRVPGAAGETTGRLPDYGIPGVIMADGPAGVRLKQVYEVDRESGLTLAGSMLDNMEGGFFSDAKLSEDTDHYYQFCTAFPVGTLLAQTFDPALVRTVGEAVAEELERFHVSWWLAPGMNIHRNPLCGRNFEYYSEDPILSGLMAAAMTRGVQSRPGVGTTIKHFACNNQEEARMGSDSVVSERALREIYLRGFELAVRLAQPVCIMTSYNRINGVQSANNRDLCTVAAREEWRFRGAIMTDWTTTFPGCGSESWKCARAGNDLIMPGYPGDPENIRAALERGDLSESDVRACARRLLNVILRTNAMTD